MKRTKTINKNKGFTLVEVLIYIVGLVAIGTVLILITTQLFGLYKEVVVVPRADRAGVSMVDRIGKEIRNADQVDVFTSKFGIPEGELNFISIDNSVLMNKIIYLENGQIKLNNGKGNISSLNSKKLVVKNLNFQFLSSPVSEAVRFSLEIEFDIKDSKETRTYTGFATLRQSHE